MRYAKVAENVQALVKDPPTLEDFIDYTLLTYGTPKAFIARHQIYLAVDRLFKRYEVTIAAQQGERNE